MQTRHPPCTIRQLLAESIRRHEHRPAIQRPQRPDLTYADFGHQIESTARFLAECGYGRRSRIAVALPHGPEFAVAVAAVCSAAVCAPLNDQLAEDAITRLLASMRVNAVIVAGGTHANAKRAAAARGIAAIELRVPSNAGAGAFELVANRPPHTAAHTEAPTIDDLAILTHTSGTTGAPKILPFEHWRIAEAMRNQSDSIAIGASDRCLFAAPFYSMAAIRHMLLRTLTVGGALICPTDLSAESLVSLLETMRPTLFLAPPVVQLAMLEAFERRVPRPRHALRFIQSGFTELSVPMQRRLERVLAVPVLPAYGTAETGIVTESALPPDTSPPGSVGRACFVDILIADEAGQALAPGQRGEVLVRGPQVFGGYEGNEEANRAAFRDGWYRTGDSGHLDRDGFLFLADRIKDIINRGGNKIAPGEIEGALTQHPNVAEAAVFAIPHVTLGEDVAAAIVLKDQGVTERDLRRFMRGRVAAFKLPSVFLVLAELPRGPLGKVNRLELASLAQGLAAADLEPPRAGVESEVAQIFADVLQLPHIGRGGNFFHLGGDSLRGMRVLAAAEARFGVLVSLDQLFDHPSVADFAALVDAAMRSRTTAGAEVIQQPAQS